MTARRARVGALPADPTTDDTTRELYDLLLHLRDTDRALFDATVAVMRALAHCRRRRRGRR